MKSHSYEAIACIEFQGTITSDGQSRGHYVCDVKTLPHGNWFKTNDNLQPKQIHRSNVSQSPYVILFRRK